MKNSVFRPHLVAGLFILTLGGTAHADAVSPVSSASFASGAAIDNRFEDAASQFAIQKSPDKSVVKLAKAMLATHRRATTALSATGVEVPPDTLEKAHQSLLDTLNTTQPQDFDKVWIGIEAKAYDEAVNLYSIYADKGGNDALKKYAQETLPDLRQDQRKLTSMQMGKGVGGHGSQP